MMIVRRVNHGERTYKFPVYLVSRGGGLCTRTIENGHIGKPATVSFRDVEFRDVDADEAFLAICRPPPEVITSAMKF
jgi:hypothetical protein